MSDLFYCGKHRVGLIGAVECDECVYEERDALRSQNARLREALEGAVYELESISEMHSDDRADYNDAARWAAEKYRKALGGGEK